MKDWGGIAAGLGTVACVVVMLIAGRLGATTDALTIYDLAGLRMGVAAILASPLLLRAWPWHVHPRNHLIIAFFGGAPFVLLLFGGMIFAPVGHAAVVMYGALPIFAALIAWVWIGEQPGRWQWLGIAAIVAGVGAVGWEALGGGAVPGQWRGHMLFVGAALSMAVWYGGMRAARLGVIQSLAAYDWAKEEITAERVKGHFSSVVKGEVIRYEMPNLWAFNFILYDSLSGGGSETLQLDAQGKTYGQHLLRMEVDVPEKLLRL